jgi:hypothetical protein
VGGVAAVVKVMKTFQRCHILRSNPGSTFGQFDAGGETVGIHSGDNCN